MSDIGVGTESGEKGGGEGLKEEAAKDGAEDMRIEETSAVLQWGTPGSITKG